MWQSVPILVLDLYPQVRALLLELLGSLDAEQWQQQTVCSGWSVTDVALHLLGGDIANISRRRDGLGNALLAYAPAGADLADAAVLGAAINDWNQAWVEASRRISPRLLIELLAVTGEALHAYFCRLDLTAIGDPVSWAGPEPAPVWLDVAREYTEQWLHQAQIRDAVGAPNLQERRLFAPVLDTFMRALPHTLRAVAAPDGTTLRLIITGAAGDTWFAVRRGDRWELRRESHGEPAASATLDQDTAWRLFTRGITRDAAARIVHLSGDTTLASAILDVVSIVA
jgi:uncharacterized protein (TIGR03083 family)